MSRVRTLWMFWSVKDQYFGDARDYLKDHLLEELMASVPGPDDAMIRVLTVRRT